MRRKKEKRKRLTQLALQLPEITLAQSEAAA